MINERELIQKSVAGDEEAFTQLMLKNQASVFKHCLSVVKDEEIAQDLTQETFVHAFQHLSSFKMQARFSTWIWRIAHNLSLNYLKKMHPEEREFKDEILLSSVSQKNEDDVRIAKIKEVMVFLPPKQRIVFDMYDLQRIPQKQIAAKLGISHGTVRSRLHYARKKIRSLLQEA